MNFWLTLHNFNCNIWKLINLLQNRNWRYFPGSRAVEYVKPISHMHLRLRLRMGGNESRSNGQNPASCSESLPLKLLSENAISWLMTVIASCKTCWMYLKLEYFTFLRHHFKMTVSCLFTSCLLSMIWRRTSETTKFTRKKRKPRFQCDV